MRKTDNVEYRAFFSAVFDAPVQQVEKMSKFLRKNRQLQVTVVFVRAFQHESNFSSGHDSTLRTEDVTRSRPRMATCKTQSPAPSTPSGS